MHVVWGIKGVDLHGTNIWDPNQRGTVVYDSAFNITSTAAQNFLLQVLCPLVVPSWDSQIVSGSFAWWTLQMLDALLLCLARQRL